jgi:hypothetical protein
LSGDENEDEDGVDAPGGVRRNNEEPH